MKRKIWIFIMSAVIWSNGGCNPIQTIKMYSGDPVTVTVWHDFNSIQRAVFEELAAEFNETVGKEKGILVAAQGFTDAEEIKAKINAGIKPEAGREAMPDLVSVPADFVLEMEDTGILADISQYLSEAELSEYMDSYIEAGKIGRNGELRLFPLAAASEVLMINKTDWDLFAEATGAELAQLETKEGLVAAAQSYYEWTDAQTPELVEDGRAFYGQDSLAGLFMNGSMQLGKELFQVDADQAALQADRDIMRHIWDFYYIPYIKGYFKAFGNYRSDDVRSGEIVAFTGSTAGSLFFPKEIEKGTDHYPIDYAVMPAPLFEDGAHYMGQEVTGMAVMKTSPEEEYAAVTFLQWLAQDGHNIAFGCPSGYLPVKKTAYQKLKLDLAIAERELDVMPQTYETLLTAFQYAENGSFYPVPVFAGISDAARVLEFHLREKAGTDRETVRARIAGGMSLNEATADFMTEAEFESWYQSFCAALEEAVGIPQKDADQ